MSKRLTKIDKAIAAIEQEIAVLQLAIVKLRQQEPAAPKGRATPRPLPIPPVGHGQRPAEPPA